MISLRIIKHQKIPMKDIVKKLPQNCPACDGMLSVKSLACDPCGTEVNGHFGLPLLACLNAEEQEFIFEFVCHSGSLKEMAQILKLSYPSIRNRLDEIIAKIRTLKEKTSPKNAEE